MITFLWFLLIPCFSFAWLQEFDLWLTESITSNTDLWYSLTLEDNANFLLDNEYRIIKFAWTDSYPSTRTYFRNWDWSTWWMYVSVSCVWWYSCNWSIQKQWYIQYVNIVDYSTIDFNYSVPYWLTPISEFLDNPIYSSPDKLLLWWYWSLQSSSVCFVYSDIDKAVCFSVDRAIMNNCSWYPQYCNYLTNDAWTTSQDLDYLKEYWTVSPFASSPKNPTIVNPTCPTVWQIKAHYNLIPSLCYAWFDSADSPDTFVWWYWLDIYQVYELYSWNMSYQAWYDTYFAYYKDFWSHLDLFSWNKLLMWTFFARNTFGKDLWSYELLNYCKLIIEWYNDNLSCCVADCTIDDVWFSDKDKENILENILWSRTDILTQSWFDTGDLSSVYDRSYWLFSSRTVPWWYAWILPSYIVIWFLGIVLLYFLRR